MILAAELIHVSAQAVARLKPKVDALLHKLNIATPEAVEQRVIAQLNSEEMRHYRKLKARYICRQCHLAELG
jgi:hypothetical protein